MKIHIGMWWGLTISRGTLLPVLVMLLGALPVSISTISEPLDRLSWQPYEIVDSADKEASLELIKSVSISHYEYKSDRGQGRRYTHSNHHHVLISIQQLPCMPLLITYDTFEGCLECCLLNWKFCFLNP